MTSTGEADISCCGKRVKTMVPMKADEEHRLTIEPVEDELYITSPHSMRKDHYLTFVAYVAFSDKVFWLNNIRNGTCSFVSINMPTANYTFIVQKMGCIIS